MKNFWLGVIAGVIGISVYQFKDSIAYLLGKFLRRIGAYQFCAYWKLKRRLPKESMTKKHLYRLVRYEHITEQQFLKLKKYCK